MKKRRLIWCWKRLTHRQLDGLAKISQLWPNKPIIRNVKSNDGFGFVKAQLWTNFQNAGKDNFSNFKIHIICQNLIQFTLDSWGCLYHSNLSIYGLVMLWTKPWFWNLDLCWANYPHQVRMSWRNNAYLCENKPANCDLIFAGIVERHLVVLFDLIKLQLVFIHITHFGYETKRLLANVPSSYYYHYSNVVVVDG